MLFSNVLYIFSLSTATLAAQLFNRNFDYSQKGAIRGVNLGGWFVLEPYMNPSLFKACGDNEDDIPVDEYHYTLKLGKDEAKKRLENHWATWLTEKDFEDMKEYGLNFARIPIGYWAFLALDEDPYVQGQVPYLDKALEWARNNDIKVWIDLHGVPGSQNGFDNSGFREEAQYLAWFEHDNLNKTRAVLSTIAHKYGGLNYSDVIVGIELVNEPLGTYLDINTIEQYYLDGYDIVRKEANSLNNVIIHDAFRTQNYWDDFMNLYDYWGVVLDHHRYQVFSVAELNRTIDEHVNFVCNQGNDTQTEYHWTVTGEWSAALTDCSKWLNGAGNGARYDASYQNDNALGSCEGIDDISTWSDEHKENTRKYIEAQLDAYDQGAGWVFWSYKTESTIEWDFKRLAAYGLFPQPLTDRKYPNICGY